MPLIEINTVDDGLKIRLWHITESEEELYSLYTAVEKDNKGAGIHGQELLLPSDLTLKSRRKQWLACRLALKSIIKSQNYEICYTINGKPYITPSLGEISFSHTTEYAAVAFSVHGNIGIDIEKISQRIDRVKKRFLSKSELMSAGDDITKLIVYWTAKESLFKYTDLNGLEFSSNLIVEPFVYSTMPFTTEGEIIKGIYIENVELNVFTIDGHILTYAVARQ